MAEQEVYLGSGGPYLYEDDETYDDGIYFRALRGDQLYIESAPVDDHEVVRLLDLRSWVSGSCPRIYWETGTEWEQDTYWAC